MSNFNELEGSREASKTQSYSRTCQKVLKASKFQNVFQKEKKKEILDTMVEVPVDRGPGGHSFLICLSFPCRERSERRAVGLGG